MSKAPAAMASLAPKMAQPMMNTMAMGSDLLGKMAPAASSIAKLPTDFIQKHADTITKKFSQPEGFLDRIWGKMDKDKMRESGIGLINQAMQQEKVSPMQLAAFQPGGGGMGGQGQPPALMQLLQQYGLNKVQ